MVRRDRDLAPGPRPLLRLRPWLLATCALSAAALAPELARAQLVANPGAVLTSAGGQAPIIAQGSRTTDITLGAPRTIIGWSSFNLASDQAVFYRFQDRSWIVLNKVSGTATIDGQIEALVGAQRGAGNVWFSAPGGVIFGPNALVTVGGLLATPAVMADAAFLDPANHSFAFTGGASGEVQVKAGAQLKAIGGPLALIAGAVSSQAGASVTASGTSSVLYGAAGDFTVRFGPQAGDLDLLDFTVPAGGGSLSATPLSLAGQTLAPDVILAVVNRASVASAVINAPGLIAAQSASTDHGDVVLAAGVDVVNRQPGGVRTNATTETTATFGTVVAQRDLLGGFGQPTAVTAAQLNAGRDLGVTAASLQAGPVNAGRLLVLDASRGITLTGGAFAGSAATLRTGGTLNAAGGSISATGRLQLDVGVLQAGRLASGRSVVVNASGAGANGAAAVDVGSALAEDDILITSANAAGSIVLGSATLTGARADEAPAGRNLSLIARGAQADVTYGAAAAGSPLLGGTSVTVAAGRDATLNVDGLLTLKSASAGRTLLIRASDLDLTGALVTGALRVESRLGGLDIGGGSQSAPGDPGLPRAPTPGMRITDAEFQFIQVTDQASFYASPPGGTAHGDLTVQDLNVTPGRVPRLLLSAGSDNDVLITGALAPTVNGGVLSIGESAESTFRPGRILVTGSIGVSTGTLDAGYTGVRAFDQVNLFATRDVILGTPRFVALIAATAPGDIDISRNAPAGSAPNGEERNRIFLTAGVLSATASQRIVQQNTGTTARPNGLYLISDASRTLLQVSPAQVIDVSGIYRDRNGALHPNLLGVTQVTGPGGGEVGLSGCGAADCSIAAVTSPQRSFQVTEDSVVEPAEAAAAVAGVAAPPPVLVFSAPSAEADDIVTDPVALSTGSDEIWRKRRAKN